MNMGTINPSFIVPRREVKEIIESKGWLLIFGRRKTGKTFLIKKFVKVDHYFFVTRSRIIFEEKDDTIERLKYDIFLERLRNLLRTESTIVVDEFQRLSSDFYDFLHYSRPSSKARVILVGSSIHVSKNLLSKRSPLLGIVKPIRLGLISPRDIFTVLVNKIGFQKALLFSPLLRDPWILEFVNIRTDFNELLRDILYSIRYIVKGLVGEIFLEEDRELTERYEAILRAVSDGNQTPRDVANYISNFLNETYKSQDVKKYLVNLMEMGLLKRKRVYKKKRYLYYIDSPLIDLFFYLDAKTGFYETDIPVHLLLAKAKVKIPFYFEDFIVELLAEKYQAIPQKSLSPEIDGILVQGGKPVAIVEVKMGKIDNHVIYKFLEKTSLFKCVKILVGLKDETTLKPKEVEVLTPTKLYNLIK